MCLQQNCYTKQGTNIKSTYRRHICEYDQALISNNQAVRFSIPLICQYIIISKLTTVSLDNQNHCIALIMLGMAYRACSEILKTSHKIVSEFTYVFTQMSKIFRPVIGKIVKLIDKFFLNRF